MKEGAMRRFLDSILAPSRRDGLEIRQINAMRARFGPMTDSELRRGTVQAKDFRTIAAATAVVASRLLGENMYDVQLRGALALARGSIAEMQTGEGTTLAS